MKIPIQTLLIFFLFISCSKDVEPEVIPKYNLKVSTTPTDGGTVTPSEGSYPNGTSISLLGTPSPEYLFKEWTGGVTGTTNPISVTMNSTMNITGVFEKRMYPLLITIEGEGTVTEELLSSKPTKDYPSGSVVKLTAVPVDGWKFESWSGDYVGLENSFNITVDKEKSVTVKFEKEDGLKYKESIIQLRTDVLNIIRPEREPSWTYSFDLENDGDLDMILIRTNSDTSIKKEMILFKNNNFEFESINTGINCWGRTVVFEDFNNDGLVDFFIADHGQEGVNPAPGAQDQIIFQTNDGQLIEKTNELLPQIYNYSHGGSSIDLENDGDFDLIINTGGEQSVLKNNDGVFSFWDEGINPRLEWSYSGVNGHPIIDGELRTDIFNYFINGYWSKSGDFNNDGYDDIIIGCSLVDSTDPPDGNGVTYRSVDMYGNVLEKSDLILLQNPDTGQLIYDYPKSLVETSWRNSGSQGVTFGLLVNDFNDDGCLDFISYSTNNKDSHRLELKIGDCNGLFETTNIFELPINSETNDNGWENFNLIDIDNDNDLDVIVSNDIQWKDSHLIPEEHVVLINDNGELILRNGSIEDLINLPPNFGISWYLDGE